MKHKQLIAHEILQEMFRTVVRPPLWIRCSESFAELYDAELRHLKSSCNVPWLSYQGVPLALDDSIHADSLEVRLERKKAS